MSVEKPHIYTYDMYYKKVVEFSNKIEQKTQNFVLSYFILLKTKITFPFREKT